VGEVGAAVDVEDLLLPIVEHREAEPLHRLVVELVVLERLQRSLHAHEGRLADLEVQIRQATRDAARQTELAARKLTSTQNLEDAGTRLASLRARLSSQQRQLTVAARGVAKAEVALANTIIRAPFDGVITVKAAQPGEIVSPISAGGGFTRTGIGTLVDMSSLEIEVDVNEAYISRVSDGQPVTAMLNAYPDWTLPAHVITIIPTADRAKDAERASRIKGDVLSRMLELVDCRTGGTKEDKVARLVAFLAAPAPVPGAADLAAFSLGEGCGEAEIAPHEHVYVPVHFRPTEMRGYRAAFRAEAEEVAVTHAGADGERLLGAPFREFTGSQGPAPAHEVEARYALIAAMGLVGGEYAAVGQSEEGRDVVIVALKFRVQSSGMSAAGAQIDRSGVDVAGGTGAAGGAGDGAKEKRVADDQGAFVLKPAPAAVDFQQLWHRQPGGRGKERATKAGRETQ
jgi:hypothetical protein